MKKLDPRVVRIVESLPPPYFSPMDKARLLLALIGKKPVTLCGDFKKKDYKQNLSLLRRTGLVTVVEPLEENSLFIFCSRRSIFLRKIIMAYRFNNEERKGLFFGYPRTATIAYASEKRYGGRFEHSALPHHIQDCAFCYITLSYTCWESELKTIRKWCQIVKEQSLFIWQQCLRQEARGIDNIEDLGNGMSRVKSACSQCSNNPSFDE